MIITGRSIPYLSLADEEMHFGTSAFYTKILKLIILVSGKLIADNPVLLFVTDGKPYLNL